MCFGKPQPLRHKNLRHHYAQVSLYAEGLPPLLDGPLVDIGIWYVLAGLVVRWRRPNESDQRGYSS